MKKSAFLANVIVWGVLSALCIGFLVWGNSVGFDFGEDTALLAASLYSRPLGSFSVGALAATIVVWKTQLKLSRTARIVWRVVGIAPAALFALAPVVIPLLHGGAGVVFAAMLLVAVYAPAVFFVLGALYGVSLCAEKPKVDDRADVRPDRV